MISSHPGFSYNWPGMVKTFLLGKFFSTRKKIHVTWCLSPPQRPFCIVGRLLCCGEAGEKEKESARGSIVPRALSIFVDYWYFDGDTQREPLRRRETWCWDREDWNQCSKWRTGQAKCAGEILDFNHLKRPQKASFWYFFMERYYCIRIHWIQYVIFTWQPSRMKCS